MLISPSTMSVEVRTTDKLSVTEAARRRERQAQQGGGKAGYDGPIHFPRDRRILDGGVLEYELATTRPGGSALSLRAGLELLGGDLELRAHAARRTGTVTSDAGDVRWRYVFGDHALLSQLALGRVHSTGCTRTRRAALNSRTGRSSGVGTPARTSSRRDGAGWEVELFVNERLYGNATADAGGRYPFAVPLGYGTTSVWCTTVRRGSGVTKSTRCRCRSRSCRRVASSTRWPVGRANDGRRVAQGSIAFGMTGWLTGRAGLEYTTDTLRGAFSRGRAFPRAWPAAPTSRWKPRPGVHYRSSLEAVFTGYRVASATLVHHDERSMRAIRPL